MAKANYMEERLNMRLRKVLPIIQEGMMERTTYFGVGAQKNPMDAWVYQEIIHGMKPDVIIEIGTAYGGGTLYLAHLCDLLGNGRIIGLDISHKDVPDVVKNHPRVSLVEGDACRNFEQIKKMISKDDRVLVIEDSSHTYD
ncbi:MAG: CmcI family methyltransferase, partial [Smithellaceae bacterium]